ncbi:MAG: 4-alpha-glucanotransferase [Acidimicrobiaceae bacterium]|nr:4-alpha-glucanotransferase [Acidimicrobiaceae bacterium]
MSTPLEALARSRGIELRYQGADGKPHAASRRALAAIAEALGDVGSLPFLVAWEGDLAIAGRLAAGTRLVGEDGMEVPAGEPLPYGYFELQRKDELVARVVSAPVLERSSPGWALFAPTYALGDLGDLGRLGEWSAGLGASAVATLPLLAEPATMDGAGPGQQPYAPLSRMFWNEANLDIQAIPELKGAEVATTGALADLAGRASTLRPLLGEAARRLLRARSARRDAFVAYRAAHPELERYCRYRADLEAAHGGSDGTESELAHAFGQFAMDFQLSQLAARLGGAGSGLLLDLPVGCRPDGYDAWAHPEAFARGASVGSPPDGFFREGQNWGFPPPHPAADRAAGYPLWRAVLSHHLAHASWLRIDHVLGWKRLWWVPEGHSPKDGAYVRNPFDELLAVACLEAWRHGARLVGEDLGTVPRGFRPALSTRGVAGMEVAIFGFRTPRPDTVAYVDTHDTATFAGYLRGSDVALRERLGLTTRGAARRELAERRPVVERLVRRLVRQGRLAKAEQDDALAVLTGVLEELGESDAELVVVALEDLLAEEEPQNLPGTTRPENFARRISRSLEEVRADPRVVHALRRLDATRRLGKRPPTG